jgi:periplasmic divalent cation tolerance protein
VSSPDLVIVLTTLPADHEAASTFARTLVEERVAACVSVMSEMHSIYAWEGTIEQERERQIVIKTTRARVPQLWNRVKSLHPYEVPEFLVLPVIDGNAAYLRWVEGSTAAGEKGAGEEG